MDDVEMQETICDYRDNPVLTVTMLADGASVGTLSHRRRRGGGEDIELATRG
jgi:hypothetical protein